MKHKKIFLLFSLLVIMVPVSAFCSETDTDNNFDNLLEKIKAKYVSPLNEKFPGFEVGINSGQTNAIFRALKASKPSFKFSYQNGSFSFKGPDTDNQSLIEAQKILEESVNSFFTAYELLVLKSPSSRIFKEMERRELPDSTMLVWQESNGRYLCMMEFRKKSSDMIRFSSHDLKTKKTNTFLNKWETHDKRKVLRSVLMEFEDASGKVERTQIEISNKVFNNILFAEKVNIFTVENTKKRRFVMGFKISGLKLLTFVETESQHEK